MFNFEKFDIKLDTEYLGRNFIYLEKVDSTNKFLLNAKEIDTFGTVVLAEEQTAGRGRMGRTWLSRPERNLTFSILLNEELENFKLSHLNLTAALSVAMALENLYQLNVNLKWPNDVLIGKKKIAGILIETTMRGEKIERAVVGIGINVNQEFYNSDFQITPTSVKEEIGTEADRERLLSEVLNIFEENLFLLEKLPGKVLDMWRSRCKMIGAKVKVQDGQELKVGKFIDIDDDGYLILLRGDKEEKIAFGDVTLREHDE